MDFDTAFFKTEKCNWADEVDREFSVAGTEDKFSQCSQDTWLYYSSSSLPLDDSANKRDRSSGRSRYKNRHRNKVTSGNSGRQAREKSTPKETGRTVAEKGAASARVVEMVQNRKKDFESCALSHAWAFNFDAHKKKHEAKEATKQNAATSKSHEKQRKVVCHQVLDGAVLVVTRRSKAPTKAPPPIKHSKKPKKPPPPSPTPSRISRADSSSDWKSDKRSVADAEAPLGFQIANAKQASRFLLGDKSRRKK